MGGIGKRLVGRMGRKWWGRDEFLRGFGCDGDGGFIREWEGNMLLFWLEKEEGGVCWDWEIYIGCVLIGFIW